MTYVQAMDGKGRYGVLFFRDGNLKCVRETYRYLMDILRRVVPRDMLVLYRVSDGWGLSV